MRLEPQVNPDGTGDTSPKDHDTVPSAEAYAETVKYSQRSTVPVTVMVSLTGSPVTISPEKKIVIEPSPGASPSPGV